MTSILYLLPLVTLVVNAMVKGDAIDRLEYFKRLASAAGLSLCEGLDPCLHGQCIESESGYQCHCEYPFDGKHCDEVSCTLERCWVKAWEDVLHEGELEQGMDDNHGNHDDSGAPPMQVYRKRPLPKRLASLPEFSKKCSHVMENLHHCLEAGLNAIEMGKEECFCNHRSIENAVEAVHGGKEKLFREYCYVESECRDPRTTECVSAVNTVVDTFMNLKVFQTRGFGVVEIGNLLDRLGKAEECVEDIMKGTIMLDGCEHHQFLTNGKLLHLLASLTADIRGCNFTAASEFCGLTAIEESPMIICRMSRKECRIESSKVMLCMRMELLKKPSCSSIMGKLMKASGFLLKYIGETCESVNQVAGLVSKCKAGSAPPMTVQCVPSLTEEDESNPMPDQGDLMPTPYDHENIDEEENNFGNPEDESPTSDSHNNPENDGLEQGHNSSDNHMQEPSGHGNEHPGMTAEEHDNVDVNPSENTETTGEELDNSIPALRDTVEAGKALKSLIRLLKKKEAKLNEMQDYESLKGKSRYAGELRSVFEKISRPEKLKILKRLLKLSDLNRRSLKSRSDIQ